MTANFSSASFEFGQPTGSQHPTQPSSDTPLRICVLGNFSGRTGCIAPAPLHQRKPIQIGCDNFDSVLKRVQPSLELCIDDTERNELHLQFSSIDHFHPDKIIKQPAMATLLQKLQQDLTNLIRSAPLDPEIHDQQSYESESDDETMKRLLGTPKIEPPKLATLNDMLQEIVAPHIVPNVDPQQKSLAAEIDNATATLLRKILHDPTFQELEATWRNLDFLIRQLDASGNIKFNIFDVSCEELAEDIQSAQNQEQTALYNILVEAPHSQAADPWGFVVGLYNFACTPSDLSLLKYFSNICAKAQAPFIAGADYESFDALTDRGINDANENNAVLWNSFRKFQNSPFVGLCLPRFLLRLPYSATTDPIEQFNFEEILKEPVHANYLWGNPAILCACLLGQSFTENGWEFTPGDIVELEGLPLHVYKQDGESKMTPCAEYWLSDGTIDGLLKLGLIPLLSVRGRDAIRIARFQSVHNPPTNLAGRWS